MLILYSFKYTFKIKLRFFIRKYNHTVILFPFYPYLFTDSASRPEAVASFLAVLELIKTNKIRVEGENASDLMIERISDEENLNVDIIDD